jgi:hypothetical protein
MKQYVFHTFRMGDVEDPELYAAQPIYEWQQTEQGCWVMEHCPDPQFRVHPDPYAWGHQVSIYGPLDDPAAVIFLLKWGEACQKS